MKCLIPSAALLVSLGAMACTESFDLSLTYTTRTTPTEALVIDNVEGSVRLVKAPVGAPISGIVKINASGFDEKAQAKEAAEAVDIVESEEGGTLVLTVALPPARNKTFIVQFELSVPENLGVSVFTELGRISVDGLVVAQLETTRGEIDLLFSAAPAGGETRLRTSEARITADSHEGPLDVATTNAPIELFSIAGDTNARTTLGAITARVIPPPGGEVVLATTLAPIDLSIPRDFGARLIAVTSAPGVVAISSELRFLPTGSFPDHAEGIIGSGDGDIDLRTTGADIVVHR